MTRLSRTLAGVRSMSGAMIAPLARSLPSLLLQVVVLRALGADDYADYALAYGIIVLLTALSSGIVGDSIVVLDGEDPRIAGGITSLGLITVLGCALGAGALAWATGLYSAPLSLLFAMSVLWFQLEDLVRMTLIAALEFWRLVVVDLLVFVFTIAVLGLAEFLDGITMADALWSIVLAQVGGVVVGIRLTPRTARFRVRLGGDMGTVFRFGLWRALQRGVTPLFLTLFRLLVIVAVSKVAFSAVEAARVFTSPLLLAVQGTAGYCLSYYARQKDRSHTSLVRNADRVSILLAAVVALGGAVALVITPLVSGPLTGGEFDLSRVTVLGWIVYTAVAAVGMSYSSLATTAGRYIAVFVARSVEAAVSLAAAWVLLSVDVGAMWTPLALSTGSVVSGVIMRHLAVSADPERTPARPRRSLHAASTS